MGNQVIPLFLDKSDFVSVPLGSIALDAYGLIFKYACAYLNQRGDPFVKNGVIVSHLMGLSKLLPVLAYGRKVYMVFDGVAHPLKRETQLKRSLVRRTARERLRELEKLGATSDDLRKQALRAVSLNPGMLESTKKLCLALGIHVVDAAEEAQPVLAHMLRSGTVAHLLSQDSDLGLYAGVDQYYVNLHLKNDEPLVRKATLRLAPDLTREHLIEATILSGCDYWPGFPRVGPKTALKLVAHLGSLENKSWQNVFKSYTKQEHGALLQKYATVRENILQEIIYKEPKYTVHEGRFDGEYALTIAESIWSSETQRVLVNTALARLADQAFKA